MLAAAAAWGASAPQPSAAADPAPDLNLILPLTEIQESMGSFLGGAIVSISKIAILHPLDTVSVRLQTVNQAGGNLESLLDDLYNGIVPPLIYGIPSGMLCESHKCAV